jgi:aspartyl protease family protein
MNGGEEHRMRSIFLFAAVIFGLALFAPDLLDRWSEQAQAEDASRRAASVNSRANDYRREVEIPSSRDGHFYVDVDIEGRSVSVMVDTGATIVALRESDAERAGIRVHTSDFDQPMSTANGVTYAAAVTLRRVTIDGIEVRDVDAVVLPDEQLHISLLGASFLNHLRRFQVADNVLVMEN